MGQSLSSFRSSSGGSNVRQDVSGGYHDLEPENNETTGFTSLLSRCCPAIFSRHSRKRRRSENDESSDYQRSKVFKLDAATDTDSITGLLQTDVGTQVSTATTDSHCQTEDIRSNKQHSESHAIRSGKLNLPAPSSVETACDEDWLNFPFLTDSLTVQHFQVSKVMMIMRGLPGSGKSYLVNKIKSMYPQCKSCSADDFFLCDGEYNFQADKIKDAHLYCQTTCEQYCRYDTSLILVDNTNVKRWEIKSYLDLAQKYRYLVVLVEPRTPWKFDFSQLAQRNSHGVEEKTIRRRIKEYETIVPRYFGWFLNRRDSISLIEESNKLLLRALLFSKEFFDDFKQFSGCDNLQEMLYFYTRNNCMGSGKYIVHLTTKFFRFNKNGGSIDLSMYDDYLGLSQRLAIGGFCISKDTFSARVILSQEQQGLWEQNDTEMSRQHVHKNGGKTGPGAVCVQDDDTLSQESHLHLLSSLSSTDQQVTESQLLEQHGRRAHFTIGTSGDTRPVESGLDMIKCISLLNSSQQKIKLPSGPGVPGATLIKLSSSLWFIQLQRFMAVDATFTGSY